MTNHEYRYKCDVYGFHPWSVVADAQFKSCFNIKGMQLFNNMQSPHHIKSIICIQNSDCVLYNFNDFCPLCAVDDIVIPNPGTFESQEQVNIVQFWNEVERSIWRQAFKSC